MSARRHRAVAGETPAPGLLLSCPTAPSRRQPDRGLRALPAPSLGRPTGDESLGENPNPAALLPCASPPPLLRSPPSPHRQDEWLVLRPPGRGRDRRCSPWACAATLSPPLHLLVGAGQGTSLTDLEAKCFQSLWVPRCQGQPTCLGHTLEMQALGASSEGAPPFFEKCPGPCTGTMTTHPPPPRHCRRHQDWALVLSEANQFLQGGAGL